MFDWDPGIAFQESPETSFLSPGSVATAAATKIEKWLYWYRLYNVHLKSYVSVVVGPNSHAERYVLCWALMSWAILEDKDFLFASRLLLIVSHFWHVEAALHVKLLFEKKQNSDPHLFSKPLLDRLWTNFLRCFQLELLFFRVELLDWHNPEGIISIAPPFNSPPYSKKIWNGWAASVAIQNEYSLSIYNSKQLRTIGTKCTTIIKLM